MVELTHEASAQYWFEYPDPIIYKVITFMESVEDWTLDGDPMIESSLATLSDMFSNMRTFDFNKLKQSENFIKLIAYLKTGRGLRILQALDTIQPGSASKILIFAEENSIGFKSDPAYFFLQRNIIFERLRLLSRTFSLERQRLIMKALEGDDQ